MSSVGWKIQKQTKDYGPYIVAELDGDELRVRIKPNPLGLQVREDALPVVASREAADKVCYVLNNLLEEVESIQARTTDVADLPEAGTYLTSTSILPSIDAIRAASRNGD